MMHTDEKGPEGYRQLLAQTPHVEYVMLFMQGLDDDPCTQKEQCLEKGMDHEVEHGCHPCAGSQREKHVTYLAHGRVSQDAFDITLDQGAGPGDEQGGGTNDRHHVLHHRGQFEKDMGAGNEVNPCRHHCGCMDEGAHRCRANHGIGQPRLQR